MFATMLAKSVVAGDAISFLCAASGVVAIRVDGLRAQRARDFIGEERDAETVHHRCAEVVRTHNGLIAVFLGVCVCLFIDYIAELKKITTHE